MVLGLLKPTIQHSIGMTELDYAYVVDAGFSLQYLHSYAPLFYTGASAYLVAWLLICILAPGLRRAEMAA